MRTRSASPVLQVAAAAALTVVVSLWCNNFAVVLVVVDALNPAEIKGFKFFDSVTGDEIVLRGVDYYPRPNKGDLNHNSLDLFTEKRKNIWKRDIPFLQELGVNAVRLYAVDPTEDHDDFMCAMEVSRFDFVDGGIESAPIRKFAHFPTW